MNNTDINPGVRKLVKLLNDNGFVTTDSGDGVTHDHACDRDYAFVVIASSPDSLIKDTHAVWQLLMNHGVTFQELTSMEADPVPQILAVYVPYSSFAAHIEVTHLLDKDIYDVL